MEVRLLRSTTRSAVFELVNESCYYSPRHYDVAVNGETVLKDQSTNVFSLFRLTPATPYTVTVSCENDSFSLNFTTTEETAFVNARRFGAVGDGVQDDTPKIQAALMACPPGGTVYLPEGTYRCQSLFLPGNVTFYLDKNCTILGGTTRTDYPILPGVIPTTDENKEHYLGSWEGNPLDCFAGLINILHAENVSITGEGTLDANAEAGDWYKDPKVKNIAWRPRLFFTADSHNVLLHGVQVKNSYSWTLHPTFTDHLDILDVSIHNRADSPNTDGIDPESCEDVNIIGNRVHVGDDCIALKAGKLFLGRKLHRPCRNVVIRNCLLAKGHGGLVIGSEMSGGVQNVILTQCVMDQTDRGLRIKTRRGRGKNAVIDGLVFNNVEMKKVLAPFVINMFYFCDPDGRTEYVQNRSPLPVDERTPELGKLTFENIRAEDAEYAACWFSGLPEKPIAGITMRDVHISFRPDAKAGEACMSSNTPAVKKLALRAENVSSILLERVEFTGYEGERLQLTNVPEFREV